MFEKSVILMARSLASAADVTHETGVVEHSYSLNHKVRYAHQQFNPI